MPDTYDRKKARLLALVLLRDYPIRELARRLRMRQHTVYDMAQELSQDGKDIDIIVGFRNGGGIFCHDTIGDYIIEYYGEENV